MKGGSGTCGNVAGLAEAGLRGQRPRLQQPSCRGGLLLPQHQQIMKTIIPASLRRLLLLAGLGRPSPRSRRCLRRTGTCPLRPHRDAHPRALTTTGTAVDTLSAAELARMQLRLGAALGGVPRRAGSASGAPGAVTSLFLRGANSNQTLFLVDGIRAQRSQHRLPGHARRRVPRRLRQPRGGARPAEHALRRRGGGRRGVAPRPARQRARPGAVAVEAGSFGTVQGALSAQAATPRAATASPRRAATPTTSGRTTDSTAPPTRCGSTGRSPPTWRSAQPGAVSTAATVRRRANVGYGANDPDNQERENNQLATVFADFTPSPGSRATSCSAGRTAAMSRTRPGRLATRRRR
jgi:vitamin B12 transporter